MTHKELHHLPVHDDVVAVDYADGCSVRHLGGSAWMYLAPGEERPAPFEPGSEVAEKWRRSLPFTERGVFV